MSHSSNSISAHDPAFRFIKFIRNLGAWFACCAIVAAQYGLYVNTLSLTATLSPYISGPATSAPSAVCICLIAAALLSQTMGAPRWTTPTLLIFCLSIANFAALPGILMPSIESGPLINGRMGLDTYYIVVILACALFARPKHFYFGALLSLLAQALIANSMIGLSYGIPYFDGEMAVATMVSLCFLALGVATQYADFKPIRVILLNTEIGYISRSLALFGTSITWGCGLILFHRYGVPERSFPIEALLFTLIMACIILMAIRAGNKLESSDVLRRDAEQKLNQMVITDNLTGLLNREGIRREIEKRLVDFKAGRTKVAVALMDIDHFKHINDQFGHTVGDLVLAHIKPAITPILRSRDSVCRWGGEEFLFLLEYIDDDDLAMPLERLRHAIETMSQTLKTGEDDAPLPISASFGVSCVSHDDDGFEDAIFRADQKLYDAKDAGRNRVVFDADRFEMDQKIQSQAEPALEVHQPRKGSAGLNILKPA